MLEQAESLAARGRWTSARNKYLSIRHNHPGTDGAEVAIRRLANGFLGVRPIQLSGPSANRIDVMVMGDGYTLQKLSSFERDADDVPKAFERNKTLEEYAEYFNFYRVGVFSKDNGVDPPGEDKENTALGTAYTNRNRSHASVNRRLVGNIFDEVPYSDDLGIVFVRQVNLGATGGSGIATLSKGSSLDTICHEWGHAFAGLADEYDSDPGYTGDASESANLALTDNPEKVPWAHFLQHKYYRGKLGVHRGGGGRANGTWKPTVRDCVMMNGGDYCPVCREQIILSIYKYVDPIDSCFPDDRAVIEIPVGGTPSWLSFEVTPMAPKSHQLNISWWLLDGEYLPKLDPRRTRLNGRRRLLTELEEEPIKKSANHRKLRIDSSDLAPGTWTVVCRVEDDTKVGRHPWVLKDTRGLLVSERRWLIIK